MIASTVRLTPSPAPIAESDAAIDDPAENLVLVPDVTFPEAASSSPESPMEYP